MKQYILKNKVKLIYKQTTSKLTSISIGVDAGAAVEEDLLGLAHATEHMVYKGTKNRNEKDINRDLSNVFGFNNAMTNYPYVIYYGTLLGEDFRAGVEILSDIILHPTFSEEGFIEEMNVIKEELREWDEELEQYCEDKLFFNCFKTRRIKYPIIGKIEDLNKITLKDIKDFYERFYISSSTSISVITNLEYKDVVDIIESFFGEWNGKEKRNLEVRYEQPEKSSFNDIKVGDGIGRVQIVFPIDELNNKEIDALRLFNQKFGEGVNSILFDNLRTKHGLVYDVITSVAHEKYIKLYKIIFNTAIDNIEKTLYIIDECLNDIINMNLDNKEVKQLAKSLKLKKLFKEEQSIQLAKELSTYSVMFGDYNVYEDMIKNTEDIDGDYIIEVAKKVFKQKTLEIITRGR